MIVNVTQDDIANGTPNSGKTCPIARAIKRERPDLFYVFVGRTHVALGDKRYELPPKAMAFISTFDCNYGTFRPEPFTFEMETS